MPLSTTVAAREIDVRRLQGSNRCEQVLGAFDAIQPGERLVVVGDHAPVKLLRHLQADRKGLFEWTPVEAGPVRFRTEITRRRAEPGSLREIHEALAWDHDRLDALERAAFGHLALGETSAARETWTEFAFGLRRHIRFEELVLFPAFEEKQGFAPTAGPTAVMRLEHREIDRLIDAIGRAMAGDGSPTLPQNELRQLLGQHNMKEERILYPVSDACLGPAERDALVARIQAT
jgi:uncharacterized protein (DUF2249 family)